MDKRVTRSLAISDHNWLEPNDLAAPQFFEPTRPSDSPTFEPKKTWTSQILFPPSLKNSVFRNESLLARWSSYRTNASLPRSKSFSIINARPDVLAIRPALAEIGGSVDMVVQRAREGEVFGQQRFDCCSVFCLVGHNSCESIGIPRSERT